MLGPIDVGPVAHGGHCVARLDLDADPASGGGPGRVVFIRHALPGERVMVRVTDATHDRFWRADAVEILTPSPDRVTARCPVSGPGGCGGCDFQHVDLDAQRRLKAAVVAEQLSRLAGFAWSGQVEAVETDQTRDGLGWRTRMRYRVGGDGQAGLRAHRSHAVVPLPASGCPLADPRTPVVAGRRWPSGAELQAVVGQRGSALLVDGALLEGDPRVREEAGGRNYEVAADGFWQVHPGAAAALLSAVLDGLGPRPDERAFDLYCGVGLFAGALVDHGCSVWGVESDRRAVEQARINLADAGERARFSVGRVDAMLQRLPRRTDLVVLDPPRSGAGRKVMAAVAERRPRAIAYVACDPAALARDLAAAEGLGYRPSSIRAFDLFPMTHHVECVAVLIPSTRPSAPGRHAGG